MTRRVKLTCPGFVHSTLHQIFLDKTQNNHVNFWFDPPESHFDQFPLDQILNAAEPPPTVRKLLRERLGLRRDFKVARDDNMFEERMRVNNAKDKTHALQWIPSQDVVLDPNLANTWRTKSFQIRCITCAHCAPQLPWRVENLSTLFEQECPQRPVNRRRRRSAQ